MNKMDLARFEMLVAAYGATPSRWPDDEREAAQAFAQADRHAAKLLGEADAIDSWLFAHRVASPSRTLRAMVIDAAPRKQRLTGRAKLWWSGFALAIAGASGMLAGSAATAALEPATGNVQIYAHEDTSAYDYSTEETLP